jgi:hypothetical protein
MDIIEAHNRARTESLQRLAATADQLSIFQITRTAQTDYDEMVSCVVVAPSEDRARQAAADAAHDEGEGAWWMPTTTVARLGTAADSVPAGIVLTDVRWG